MNTVVYKKDLVLPELSYKIVGCAFDVYNELGGGHKEKVYQKALALSFHKQKLNFKEQVYFPINFNHTLIDKNFLDFIVEEKVVIEIKSLNKFTKGHYEQVLNYLNVSKLKLALLMTFAFNEVRYKRVVNFNQVDTVS